MKVEIIYMITKKNGYHRYLYSVKRLMQNGEPIKSIVIILNKKIVLIVCIVLDFHM